MRARPPRVLDASAIVALFRGHAALDELLTAAEHGRQTLLLPAAGIADAEHEIQAGARGWEAILLTAGVRSLPLDEHTAITVGGWPGDLWARHAAYEAHAVRGVVVTCQPGAYEGLRVPLLVV